MGDKRKFVVFACCAALLAAAAGGYVLVNAQDKSLPVLSSFRLFDLDGKEVSLDDAALREQRVAFCLMTTWSHPAMEQAKQVYAARGKIGGKLVFICQGPAREVRELRQKMGATEALWLVPDHSTAMTFADAFEDDMAKLDRTPALVVVNESRKVVHASTGELGAEDISKALAAKAE